MKTPDDIRMKKNNLRALARLFALNYGTGKLSLPDLLLKISSFRAPEEAAYIALEVMTYLPDRFELEVRKALLEAAAAL